MNTPNSRLLALEILCSSLIKIYFLKPLSTKQFPICFRDKVLSGIILFYCPPENSSCLVAGNGTWGLAMWTRKVELVRLTSCSAFNTWWHNFLICTRFIYLPSSYYLRTCSRQHIHSDNLIFGRKKQHIKHWISWIFLGWSSRKQVFGFFFIFIFLIIKTVISYSLFFIFWLYSSQVSNFGYKNWVTSILMLNLSAFLPKVLPCSVLQQILVLI